MIELVVSDELECKSAYGIPSHAYTWYWMEINHRTKDYIGRKGMLYARTVREAIDRMREAFPQVGAVKWVNPLTYYADGC